MIFNHVLSAERPAILVWKISTTVKNRSIVISMDIIEKLYAT